MKLQTSDSKLNNSFKSLAPTPDMPTRMSFVFAMGRTLGICSLGCGILFATASVRAENLLSNPSFEVGMAHWSCQVSDADAFARRPAIEWENPSPDVRGTDAAHGRRSLRVVLEEHQRLTLRSFWHRMPAGKARTFSISLRTEPGSRNLAAPQTEVVIEQPGGVAAATACRVFPMATWQRMCVTQPAAKATGALARVTLRARGPQTLWIDAAQLEMGEQAAPFAPRLPAEVAVTLSQTEHWFTPSTPPQVVVALVSYAAQPTNTSWQVRVTGRDFNGRGVFRHDMTVGTLSNGLGSAFVSLPLGTTGHYVVAAELDGIESRDETALAVAQPLVARPPARMSLFGGTVRCRREHLDTAARMGMRWVRMPLATQWFAVEPQAGQWQWFDDILRAAWRRGLEVLGSLDASVYWENGPQDRGARPEEWDAYVQQTVHRCRNWVRSWEVWNEPDQPGLLAGHDVEERLQNYTKLLQRTYAAAKATDPGCLIVGGALGDPALASSLLQAGAFDSMDALSVHLPVVSGAQDIAADPPMEKTVAAIKATMRARGGEKPVWVTSGGLRNAVSSYREQALSPMAGSTRPLLPREAAALVVRQHALAMSSGVDRFFCGLASPWSASEEDPVNVFFEYDDSPTAAAVAYYVANGLLDGAKFLAERTLAAGARALEFERAGDNGRVLVAWALPENGVEVQMPLEWVTPECRTVDLMGNVGKPESPRVRLTQLPAYWVTTKR
ncbi:MAG: hypothetical protein WC740_10460 [Verrucomicrobiia bacterium]